MSQQTVTAWPRKQPGVATSNASCDTTALGVDYIMRACRLVRAGALKPVLVEGGRYYIAENPADPWGSKRPVSYDQLRALIDATDRKEKIA